MFIRLVYFTIVFVQQNTRQIGGNTIHHPAQIEDQEEKLTEFGVTEEP